MDDNTETKHLCVVPRSAKTSKEQYEMYLNHLSTQNVDLYTELNKCNGPRRTAEVWKQVFREWTSFVKRKARNIFAHRNSTGGGLPTEQYLSDIEQRLLQSISMLVVSGIDVLELGLTQEEVQYPIKKSKIKIHSKICASRERMRPRKLQRDACKLLVTMNAKYSQVFNKILKALIDIALALDKLMQQMINSANAI